MNLVHFINTFMKHDCGDDSTCKECSSESPLSQSHSYYIFLARHHAGCQAVGFRGYAKINYYHYYIYFLLNFSLLTLCIYVYLFFWFCFLFLLRLFCLLLLLSFLLSIVLKIKNCIKNCVALISIVFELLPILILKFSVVL